MSDSYVREVTVTGESLDLEHIQIVVDLSWWDRFYLLFGGFVHVSIPYRGKSHAERAIIWIGGD